MTPVVQGLPRIELPTERFSLRCGATLLVSRRPGATVTATRVHLRGGPARDPKGKEGLAYLTGRLVDQGTKRHSESELAELLEPAGGELSGDATGLAGTIAGGDWRLLLEVMAELLTSATYPEAEFARQRERLLTRLAVERDDPRAQGARRFRRLVYGTRTWLGRPAWGDLESVAGMKAKDLRAHRRSAWVGSRATIAVCGDVDPQQVCRHLDRLLADWRTGQPLGPLNPVLPPRAVRVDTFRRQREQVHVYLGHLGVRRKHEDFAALVIMDHVLGTGPGFTNRLGRRLRDELGLAYSVSADIHSSAGKLPGMFTAYIGTSPQHLETAVGGFLQEMRRIQDEPVSADELETARSYLLGSFVLGFERASRRANYLIAAEAQGLPKDELERLPRAFAAVTIEDVQRAARAHLHPDACCLSVSGPVTKARAKALLGR
jgi:zinc protease